MLRALSGSPLAAKATFGGATALSVVYLHHRRSDDVDLFLPRSPTRAEIDSVIAAARGLRMAAEVRIDAVRHMFALTKRGREVGHVDIAMYPYDPVDKVVAWHGLRVDSLLDIAVNKVQALLTRARMRDYVDLYYLLREGPERDIERLLAHARAKFDMAFSRVTVGERLMGVNTVTDLPEMIRPLAIPDLRRFFEQLARTLVRRGP